jgi:hypothetical protein
MADQKLSTTLIVFRMDTIFDINLRKVYTIFEHRRRITTSDI